jgi:hypothetical protein
MGVHIVETVVDLNKKLLSRGFIVYRFGSGESPEFWEKQNAFGGWEPITDRQVEQALDQDLGLILNQA